VFCCPYAGGSSLAYERWQDLDPDIEVVALDYPGRLLRDEEPLLRSTNELVPWMFEEIAGRLDRPFSLVGSSLGAIIAFELAGLAESRGLPPCVVMLCACAAPSRLRKRAELSARDDAGFLAEIAERYGSAISALSHDPEARGVFLPILRADIETFEGYDGSAAKVIRSDIIAVRGERDKAVRFADIAPWRNYSRGSVALLSVAGDHFFVESRPGLIVQELRGRLLSAGE
jgi:surfactin synthase thioesterase subunit